MKRDGDTGVQRSLSGHAATALPVEEMPELRVRRGSLLARRHAMSPRLRALLALALGALCLGFSAIFTKWAGVPGPVSALYRVAISTTVLAVPFAAQMGRRSRVLPGRTLTWAAFGLASLAGLFFALDLGFWNSSLQFTSAANSTLVGNASTLWVSLGGALLFHESLRRRFWAGMVLALVGVAIVMGRDAIIHPSLGWGDALAICSSLFYAGYMLTTQRARQRLGTLPFMWLSSVVAALLLLGFTLATGQTLYGFTVSTYLALIALGLISHVLGWLSINYALGHLPASITAVALLSQPVITAVVAVPLLGEALSLYQVGGGLLVLLGIFTVVKR